MRKFDGIKKRLPIWLTCSQFGHSKTRHIYNRLLFTIKAVSIATVLTFLSSACTNSKHNDPLPTETIADVQAKLVGHHWVTNHAVGTKQSDGTKADIPNGAVYLSDATFTATALGSGTAAEGDYPKGLKWVLNSTTNLVVTLNEDTDPNDVINATISFSSDGHTLTLDYKGTITYGTTYTEVVQTLAW